MPALFHFLPLPFHIPCPLPPPLPPPSLSFGGDEGQNFWRGEGGFFSGQMQLERGLIDHVAPLGNWLCGASGCRCWSCGRLCSARFRCTSLIGAAPPLGPPQGPRRRSAVGSWGGRGHMSEVPMQRLSSTGKAGKETGAAPFQRERDFFIDNLLVRIHFSILMIRWSGLARWESEFSFPGSPTSIFPCLWSVQFVFGTASRGGRILSSGRARDAAVSQIRPRTRPQPPYLHGHSGYFGTVYFLGHATT